jgi:hypothetical protein
MNQKRPVYADLGDIQEDDRIELIGRAVTDNRATVAFIVEAGSGKAERYIQKLTAKFPSVRVLGQFAGPVPNTTTVRVGPLDVSHN